MPIPPHYASKIPINHPMNPEPQPQNNIPPIPQNYPQMHPQMNPQHMPPNNMHMMNMRPENQYPGAPTRNYNNYIPQNSKNPMINNARPNPPPTRMNSGPAEFITPNNMGGMAITRDNPRNNLNLRYMTGPNMGGANMNNPGGVNGVPINGVNRSNVYQLNQINTVNNIKNEQLKLVKKTKN